MSNNISSANIQSATLSFTTYPKSFPIWRQKKSHTQKTFHLSTRNPILILISIALPYLPFFNPFTSNLPPHTSFHCSLALQSLEQKASVPVSVLVAFAKNITNTVNTDQQKTRVPFSIGDFHPQSRTVCYSSLIQLTELYHTLPLLHSTTPHSVRTICIALLPLSTRNSFS